MFSFWEYNLWYKALSIKLKSVGAWVLCGFSNMASGWLKIMLPGNQKPGWKHKRLVHILNCGGLRW